MKRTILNLLMLSMGASLMQGAVPDGYYNSLEGLTGKALRQAAAKRVSSHTAVSYGDNTWAAFKSTDVRIVGGKETWWDMYSPDNVAVSSGHPGMNIEHSVANSWWGGSKNDAYKDLFHLNPSNSNANSRKSNYPLGEISNVTWDNGVTFVGNPVSGQGGGNKYVYEPADEYKGDFARVFMYMFTVYETISWKENTNWMYEVGSEDMFKPWAVELLLKWHRQDPVSQKEIDRNEAIYKIQHNRNPYIDSPELAEYVWGSKKGQPYSFTGDYEYPDPGVDPDPGKDPDPGVDPEPANSWVIVNSMADINADDKYILVAKSAGVAMGLDGGSTAYAKYFTPTGNMPVIENNGTSSISRPNSSCAVLKFIPSGSNYVASVSDMDGKLIGYFNCTAAKNVNTVASEGEASPFSLSVSSEGAVFDFGSNGKLYYNPSSPRFTTYTSNGQEKPFLYRYNEQIETSVTDIIDAEEDGILGIYTLQGVNAGEDLESLSEGVYIVVKRNGSTSKILVK